MLYQKEYLKSVKHPEEFWQEKANELEWFEKPTKALSQDSDGMHHWFSDGKMNTSYMMLDHHVNHGRANQNAIIYDSHVTNTIQTYTYKQLLDAVAKCAGMIQNMGVAKGDRVVIYMSMTPEAVIAMLACSRLGAIHAVVFGGFAAKELAVRIDDCTPKLIISSSCGIEVSKVIQYKPLLDKAIDIANHRVDKCIIYQRPQYQANMIDGRDFDWNNLYTKANPVSAVTLRGDDPLYILYTSGTTGTPKGIMRENGGHAVALKYSMSAIYDTYPGEVYWSASDIGWVVGHSYIVYAPLLQGCTTILYEGKPIMTPDAGAFWHVIEKHKVKSLFTAPTAYRAIKKEDPNGEFVKKYDISSLKNVFSAGERLDEPTYNWINKTLNTPVIDNWWQTETGWAIASNIIGIEKMPTKPGSVTFATPGFCVQILDDSGKEVGHNIEGNIAIKLPIPPGCSTSIWGNKKKFIDEYLSQVEGYYISGDGGFFDEDGYLFVMGRTDDVINVAGHRLSTGMIEEVIASHQNIAECAVIGASDSLKGQLPMGFVVLKSGAQSNKEKLAKELIAMVRDSIGAIVCYKETIILKRLPKTRSGKILRKTMKCITDNKPYATPVTIDDLTVLDEIKISLKEQR